MPTIIEEIYQAAYSGAKDAISSYFGENMAVDLTKAQVAKFLKVSRPTLDRYIASGYLKPDPATGRFSQKELMSFNITEVKHKKGLMPLTQLQKTLKK